MPSYMVCSLRLNSDVPLPYLKEAGQSDIRPDVHVRTAHIRADLGRPTKLPFLRVGENGTWHFGDDFTPHFLVRSDEVIADPRHGNWREKFVGPIIGTLCYLHDLLPLHASAVRVGSNAVAFVGPSGAGKSTLAALMATLGNHDLVADEICAINVGGEVPQASPYLPYHRLSERSAALLGVANPLEHRQDATDDKSMIAARRFARAPCRLRAVYFIDPHTSAEPQATSAMPKLEAILRLQTDLYRHDIGQVCAGHDRLLRAAAQLVDAVEVRRLCRGPDHLPPEALLTMIEDDIRQLG